MVHPLLGQLFTALDDQHLTWLLLRGVERLARPTGDVDLLVAARDLAGFDRAATRIGFRRQATALLVPRRSYVAYVPGDDLWLRLDVVTRVSFGPLLEYDTSTAEACLQARRREGAVAVPAPDDAFWHLLLHYLLDRGAVPEQHRATVVAAAREAGATGPLATLVDDLLPDLGSEAFLGAARRGAWDELDGMAAALRRSWAGRRSSGERLVGALHRSLQQVGAAQRSGTRPGLTVAILGPDGAGKTTLADGLRASLGFPSRYVYHGLWRAGTLDRLASPVPGLRFVLLLGQLAVRTGRTRYHQLRGRLVLMDRFTYDAHLVDADADILQRFTAFLVPRLCREPDLVIILDLPGGVAFARKGEQSVAEMDRWRERYLELGRTLRHAVVLDATEPAEVVQRKATAAIWAAVGSRGGRPAGPRDPGGPGR